MSAGDARRMEVWFPLLPSSQLLHQAFHPHLRGGQLIEELDLRGGLLGGHPDVGVHALELRNQFLVIHAPILLVRGAAALQTSPRRTSKSRYEAASVNAVVANRGHAARRIGSGLR